LKKFESEFLSKGVKKLEHEDMKIYVIGVDNKQDPYRVKLIRDTIKESKSDLVFLELCES